MANIIRLSNGVQVNSSFYKDLGHAIKKATAHNEYMCYLENITTLDQFRERLNTITIDKVSNGNKEYYCYPYFKRSNNVKENVFV